MLGGIIAVPTILLAFIGLFVGASYVLFESHDARCSAEGQADLERLALALPVKEISKEPFTVYAICDSGGTPSAELTSRLDEELIVATTSQLWGCTELTENDAEEDIYSERSFRCDYAGAEFDLTFESGTLYAGERYVSISLTDSYSPNDFPEY